ncbi:Hypothetical protein D9617_20g028620 [Elsinoe fawcettii]|nr:Hypothetical protein D9617_20g028620 [Elsinoe fawcettii]
MPSSGAPGVGSEPASSWVLFTVSTTITESPVITTLRLGDFETAIHKALLVHFSGYYHAALCGNFAEATTQQIDPIDDIFRYSTVESFVAWMYTGNLTLEPTRECDVFTAVQLYIFADRYVVPALKYIVTHWMKAFFDTSPGHNLILNYSLPSRLVVDFAYEHLLPEDNLCVKLIQIYACYWTPPENKDNDQPSNTDLADFPEVFRIGLLPALARLRGNVHEGSYRRGGR